MEHKLKKRAQMFLHNQILSGDLKTQTIQPEREGRETEQLFPFSYYRASSETGQSLMNSAWNRRNVHGTQMRNAPQMLGRYMLW